MHGGSSPKALEAAKRRGEQAHAEAAVEVYGLPVTVDPHRALLEELWRTNGHIVWLRNKLSDEGEDAMAESVYGAEGAYMGKQPSVWMKLYAQERTHLAKVARDCVQSGVEERMVRVLELSAEAFVTVMQAQLVALGVDPLSDQGRRAMDAGLAALPEGLVA
jgi:hypothetical protein